MNIISIIMIVTLTDGHIIAGTYEAGQLDLMFYNIDFHKNNGILFNQHTYKQRRL